MEADAEDRKTIAEIICEFEQSSILMGLLGAIWRLGNFRSPSALAARSDFGGAGAMASSGELSATGGAARRALRWLSGRVLPRVAYPVVRGPLRGRWFVLGAAGGAGGGASVYVNHVEPKKTDALLRVLKPGQVVFDVGADIGYTLLAALRTGPGGRVFAFEPSPRNISYLHRHLVLNGATNVVVVPAACSDSSGLAMFEESVDCAEGRLAEPRAAGGDSRLSLVATVTIDEVVRVTGRVPDVMKIDVEGAEERVLRGAARTLASMRPTLILAVHSEAARVACTTVLTPLGYTAET